MYLIISIISACFHFKLAKKHNKNDLLWGLISAFFALASQYILLEVIIYFHPKDGIYILSRSTTIIFIASRFLFSTLCSLGLYYYLKNKWEKEENTIQNSKADEIDEIGKN